MLRLDTLQKKKKKKKKKKEEEKKKKKKETTTTTTTKKKKKKKKKKINPNNTIQHGTKHCRTDKTRQQRSASTPVTVGGVCVLFVVVVFTCMPGEGLQ